MRCEGEKSEDDEMARACNMHRRIILKWILKRDDDMVLAWIDFSHQAALIGNCGVCNRWVISYPAEGSV